MIKAKTLFILLILLPVTYAVPDDPDIFYGDVYLNGNLLNSGTLGVYVNGELTDTITVTGGSFGGPDILDEKLIASGYDGDEVTFALDVSGYTINSDYTVYRNSQSCGDCIEYDCCQEYVKIEFSGTAIPTNDGGGTSGGGTTGGGGGFSGGGGTTSTSGGTTTSLGTTDGGITSSGSGSSTSGDSNSGGSSNETTDGTLDPFSGQNSNESSESGVVLQQESPIGGFNLYLALAAILLILIAVIAAWYQSKAKPEVLPSP